MVAPIASQERAFGGATSKKGAGLSEVITPQRGAAIFACRVQHRCWVDNGARIGRDGNPWVKLKYKFPFRLRALMRAFLCGSPCRCRELRDVRSTPHRSTRTKDKLGGVSHRAPSPPMYMRQLATNELPIVLGVLLSNRSKGMTCRRVITRDGSSQSNGFLRICVLGLAQGLELGESE